MSSMIEKIPRHPQPGFFETTAVLVDGNLVTHHDIEAILEAPPWSFQDAMARVEARSRTRKRDSRGRFL